MDVAIIGMAGRFPEAANLEQFRANLRAGKDNVREYAKDRLTNTSVPRSDDYELFGYLENIDRFDHEFFNLSLGEAQHMDPHQRLLLEVVYETFESGGYNPDYFRGSNTAVYVGDVTLEYSKLAAKFEPTLATGNLNSVTAGRLSRFFDLRGTSLMVDTACSSSLVALHLACNELVTGEADFALACGVNIKLFPGRKNKAFQLGISSPDGKTRSFSADAEGTGGGEAVGCVLLKPLQKAMADGDIIYAVVKGTAVNQDAALAANLTAPSSAAQADVIRKAWKRARIDPSTIAYIEAHGTGTKLGDPIEVQGINAAFSTYTTEKHFCALSSVKSNLGHTNSAAGISGLVKAVLSLRYRELYPSLHFSKPNPLIDFNNAAVYVNTILKPWAPKESAIPFRAGVSSFGISGTNCHVVLEEGPVEAPVAGQPAHGEPGYLVPVSARSPASLLAGLEVLREYLARNPGLDIADVARTLTVGRKHFPHRFATVAASVAQLNAQLADGLAGLLPEPSQPPRLVFIFPARVAEAEARNRQLCRQHPVFKSFFDACCRAAPATNPEAFHTFAFQYCLCKTLESLGVRSKTFVGDGVGKWVAAALTESTPLEVALQSASELPAGGPGISPDRCTALLKKLENEYCVFAQLGPCDDIGGLLESHESRRRAFELVCVRTTSASTVLNYVQDVYLAGYTPCWEDFGRHLPGRRVALPLYQFEKKRCWIREPEQEKVDEWLYGLTWKVAGTLPPVPTVLSRTVYLVVAGNGAPAAALAQELEKQGNETLLVQAGDTFRAVGANTYELCPRREEDYRQLAAALTRRGIKALHIIYLGGTDRPTTSGDVQAAAEGLAAPFHLARAFGDAFAEGAVSLMLFTANGRKVAPPEAAVPGQAALHGFTLALNEEYGSLRVKCVDVDEKEQSGQYLARVVAHERGTDHKVSVAYRQGVRYVPQVKRLPAGAPAGEPKVVAQKGGVYVVTGGTSPVGLAACQWLADGAAVQLVVLGKASLPDKNTWPRIAGETNHPHSRIIGTFQAVEASGSRVEYYAAETADRETLSRVFDAVRVRYGGISGVVHAEPAGLARPAGEYTFEDFRNAFTAGAAGLVHLRQLAAGSTGFFVVFSTYHALIGSEKDGPCGASALFGESWLDEQATAGSTVVVWPPWRAGTGADPSALGLRNKWVDNAALEIDPEEVLRLMRLVPAGGHSRVIVSRLPPEALGPNPYFGAEDDLAETPAGTAPEPEAAQQTEGTTATPVGQPGWTATECRLKEIWFSALKKEHIEQDDDYFDLGGHSLNGLQVVNQIEKVFGLQIEFEELFDYGTIRSLGARLDALLAAGSAADPGCIKPVGPQDYYEVSHAQKRLWVLQELDKNSVAYNIPSVYAFAGQLDTAAFRRAFEALVERHEILRTTFVTVEGELRQQIHAPGQFAFRVEYTDLREAGDGAEEASRFVRAEAGRPFDLKNGPLIRAHLFRVAETQYSFFLALHHIIADGWSYNVLAREVMMLYDAFARYAANPLPPLALQYKDYAAWHNEQLRGSTLQEHRQYWIDHLAGCQPLSFPLSYDRPARKSHAADRLSFVVSAQAASGLKALSGDHKATLFMTLLTILKVLLYKNTEQADIAVGSPIASRQTPELENQIGLYLNTVVYRTQLDETETFADLLGKVRTHVLEAGKHQQYPFDKLVEELGVVPAPNRNALFDVGFTYNNFNSIDTGPAGEGDGFGELGVQQNIDHGFRTVKADIWLHATERESDIIFSFDYSTELFRPAAIEKIVADYQYLLLHVMRNPGATLAELVRATLQSEQHSRREKQLSLRKQNLERLKQYSEI